MQDEPKNTSRCTPASNAAWITLISIARFSYRNDAGRDALATMPPTRAAASNTTSTGCCAKKRRTAAWSVRSSSARAGVSSRS
ncbi:hypothetical protein D9M70_382900 [compost metagenome]